VFDRVCVQCDMFFVGRQPTVAMFLLECLLNKVNKALDTYDVLNISSTAG
jgi:anti-anti-sigma regulatory factor